jgi:16S rRNA processing protein RimM
MLMKTDAEYVVVGKIGATFGIKGWLKINSFTELTKDILNYTPWYLNHQNNWKAIIIQDGHQHGKGVIAKLKGYDTPEQARILTGKDIAIKRSQLPALNKHEYYWSDLIGLMVVDQAGKELGIVSYIMETGTHDVLVIKSDKEHGIPYLPGDVVLKVDLENRLIHVNWELI